MLSYRELADRLVPYVADLGFTHVELLPIAEFPFDGSWGYQPTGLYAPTARFGPPWYLRFFCQSPATPSRVTLATDTGRLGMPPDETFN